MRFTETVNDADGLLANFWRALMADPDGVTKYADLPVIEQDLEARHLWIVNHRQEITDGLNDPDFFNAKAAGWWVWGASSWIAGGWCSGKGPWVWDENKRIVNSRGRPDLGAGKVVNRQFPHLGDAGQGARRKLPHLGSDGGGVNRKLPHLGGDGRGVNRKLPNLGDGGNALRNYLATLSDRLRWVRVCSGDWSRITGPTCTVKHGITGVFLDPPYSVAAGRDMRCYAIDCGEVAHDVCAWCEEWGRDSGMRICLAGYSGEGHEGLKDIGWREMKWTAAGGYENQTKGAPSGNRRRECLWFSPACLDNDLKLF